MAILALAVALRSLRYVFSPDLILEEGWGHHLFSHPIATYFHFTSGPLALLAGGLQFLLPVQRGWPAAHKTIGRIYVATCCLAGLSAIPLAIGTESGPVAASGLFLLAIVWIATTVRATCLAMNGNIPAHRRWMTRSYALTYAGVLLRLMLAVGTELLGFDYDVIYPGITWLCWLSPLIVVEARWKFAPGDQKGRPGHWNKVRGHPAGRIGG